MIIIKLAWRNLYRNSRRTIASLVTIAIGAAGLLIYQGFQNGMMNQYREGLIRVRYSHGQIFSKGYYNTVLEKPWTKWISNHEALEKRLIGIDGIVQTFPRVRFYSFLQKGEINLSGHGEGVISKRENLFFTNMNFEHGNEIKNDNDIILGKGLAKGLNAKVGETITVLTKTVDDQFNKVDVVVSGIFHTGVKEFDDKAFRINLHIAKQLLNTDVIELIALQTTGVEAWKRISPEIDKNISNVEAIPFEELDSAYYKNAVDFLNSQFNFIRIIILLIVALGIFNIISNSLLERKGEIGSLRANGEPRKRLFIILIMENAFLGLIGGVVGCVFSALIHLLFLQKGIPIPPAPGMTRSFNVLLEMENAHYIQALILPTITTVLASAYPILHLINKNIPELLKSND